MFGKKPDAFALRLQEIAKNLHETSNYYVTFKLNGVEDTRLFSSRVKEFEITGDKHMHDLIQALNTAFITQIDREDILALANALDDILDGYEEAASLFEIYNITKADGNMVQFVNHLFASTEELLKATDQLVAKKLLAMREHVVKVKAIETTCDELRRSSIKELLANESDAITIMKYKEIYEAFENIADYCQEAANVIETIITKNA